MPAVLPHSHTRGGVIEPPHPKSSPATPAGDSAFPWDDSCRAGALRGAGLEVLRDAAALQGLEAFPCSGAPRMHRGRLSAPEDVQQLTRAKISPGARDVPGRTAGRARRRMQSTKCGFPAGWRQPSPASQASKPTLRCPEEPLLGFGSRAKLRPLALLCCWHREGLSSPAPPKPWADGAVPRNWDEQPPWAPGDPRGCWGWEPWVRG